MSDLAILQTQAAFEKYWLTMDEMAKRSKPEQVLAAATIMISNVVADPKASVESKAAALSAMKLMPLLSLQLGYIDVARVELAEKVLERMRMRFQKELPA